MATSITSNFSGFSGSKPEVSMEMQNPVTVLPSAWPVAELCRRGSCYTLIRGDNNNTEQPSYPAPGFGAPCASTALGGASPESPAIPVPLSGHADSALAQPQLGTAVAPGTRSAADKPSCCPGAPGGRCCSSAGSLPEPPAHPVPPAGSGFMVRSSSQRDGWRGKTISAPPPPLPAFPG